MKRFGRLLLLVSLFSAAGSTHSAHAATPGRILIQVKCACEDAGGRAYLEAFHQALTSSQTFQEVSLDSGNAENVIRVNIVSAPLAPEAAGGPTRTSFTITSEHNGAVMNQSVETCNRVPIQPCVEAMLEALSAL